MRNSAPQPAIAIQNLTKTYPGQAGPAIDNLSLTIESGSIFGLLGPNGAGKTTLISVLCTLLRPSAGEVFLLGHNIVKDAQKIRRCIGFVPQEIALYPSLTARENLRYFGEIQQVAKHTLHKRIDECLEVVGLKEQGDQRIENYSGGMKRRINLAVGILHEPAILFLDEPTVGIDPQSRNLIFERIGDFNKQGMTVIYTTHYMEEAQQLCDKVAIMDRGKIVALDAPAKLIGDDKHCTDLEELFLSLTGRQLRD